MKGFVGLRIILDYNGSDYDNLYRKQRKSILKSKSQWFLFTNGQLKTLNYITLVQSIEIFVSSANAEQMMSQLTLCREFFFFVEIDNRLQWQFCNTYDLLRTSLLHHPRLVWKILILFPKKHFKIKMTTGSCFCRDTMTNLITQNLMARRNVAN